MRMFKARRTYPCCNPHAVFSFDGKIPYHILHCIPNCFMLQNNINHLSLSRNVQAPKTRSWKSYSCNLTTIPYTPHITNKYIDSNHSKSKTGPSLLSQNAAIVSDHYHPNRCHLTDCQVTALCFCAQSVLRNGTIFDYSATSECDCAFYSVISVY